MPKSEQFVGRNNELDQLKEHISKFAAAPAGASGLQIVSVSGSGGVGKTFLLDEVLDETRGELKQALKITIDASNEHLL